jgi:heterodisulfide reductase subunit B
MKTIGYYPGCSLSGTAAEYGKSLKAIAGRLEVELKEVPEWVCCGATSAHAIDHTATLCLAADTLAKAKRAGTEEVLAPCAMCYQRLAAAVHEIKQTKGLGKRVAEALGENGDLGLETMKPVSILSWLAGIPEEELKKCVSKPLKGLKVACYYGCLLIRPANITGETEMEMPRSMEKLVTALGAEVVRWPMAMECCGGSFSLSRKGVVIRQCRRIFDSARKAGADVMCMACPMCHSNLDMRQAEFAPGEAMPMVYLTQLIGLAFGLDGEALGFKGHFVPVEPGLTKAMSRSEKDASVSGKT